MITRLTVFFCLFFLLASGASAQITFVIESMPKATPGSDTIFICGTFNNWLTNDKRYAVTPQLDGSLAVTVEAHPGSHEYKFTRGSWTKVETDNKNQYIKNRSVSFEKNKIVYVQIDNWLDLGGAKQFNYATFYFFACAFQGILLGLFVYRIQKKAKTKFKAFLIFNLVIAGALALLIIKESVSQIWQSYFAFAFHVSLFCWSPLLLYFIHTISTGKTPPRLHLYFIPAGVALLFVIGRILNLSMFDFLSATLGSSLSAIAPFLITASLFFNGAIMTYLFKRFSFITGKNRDPKLKLLFYTFWINAGAFVLLPLNVILIYTGISGVFIDDFGAVAVALSSVIFLDTYFLWRYPEIIKEEKTYSLLTDDSRVLLTGLNNLMATAKPYKDPELTVNELAEMLHTRPHVLSRIINDRFQKNFRDFVNAYRVEEFISLAETNEFKHYTFLALAQEVGFNSKSTFNLAFKKLTNQSPREYFKAKELDHSSED